MTYIGSQREGVPLAGGSINIRPGVSVLAVFRHLHYKPWYALAEFVDNSLGSYLANQDALERLHGEGCPLHVKIVIDAANREIRVKDDAAGIAEADFPRAFRPAAIPPDRSGLSEFGMGMKSAACWFAPRWSVRTSALGEPVARIVRFDIGQIVHDDIEDVEIQVVAEDVNAHYTELVLEDVHHLPVKRSLGKLREHLSDIYRNFIRGGSMVLEVGGPLDTRPLEYVDPEVLVAPHFAEEAGEPLCWRKDVHVELGDGRSAWGFAALRKQASTSRAGFALFRRGRVIQGTGDEGYRPEYIFGKANSYRYQRLFGELHLEGFEVSHTKDGIQWDGGEQELLEKMKLQLDAEPLPMLQQAEKFRVRANRLTLQESATQALESTVAVIEGHLPDLMPDLIDAPMVETPSEVDQLAGLLVERVLSLQFRGQAWEVTIQIADDPSESQWLVVGQAEGADSGTRRLHIQLAATHPFMVRYAQMDTEQIEALLRVATALAVSEVLARESGVQYASTVRRNVNELLRACLSSA